MVKQMPKRKVKETRKRLIQKPLFKPEELNIKKLTQKPITIKTKKKLEQTQLFKKNPNEKTPKHKNKRRIRQDPKALQEEIQKALGKQVDREYYEGKSLQLEGYKPSRWTRGTIQQIDETSLASQMIIQNPKEEKKTAELKELARKKNTPNKYKNLIKKIKGKKT